MAKCIQCSKEFDIDWCGVLVNADADFACSIKCKDDYKIEMKTFLDNIHDDVFYNNWLKG